MVWYGRGGGQFGGKSFVNFGFTTDRAYGVSGLVNFWLQVLVIMHISLEIHLEMITRVVKTLPCVAAYMSSLSIIAIAIDR